MAMSWGPHYSVATSRSTTRQSRSTGTSTDPGLSDHTVDTLNAHYLELYGTTIADKDDSQAQRWLETKVADLSRSLILLHFREASESSLRALLSRGVTEDAAEEIKDLRDAIVASLTLHNARVPINCLPTEILENILSSLVASHISPIERSKHVVRAASVCRRWRAVAVGSHALWSHITLNKRLTRTFIARSASVPIDFTFESNQPYALPMGAHKALFTCAERTRTFSARLDRHTMINVLNKFPADLPILESLTLNCTRTVSFPDTELPRGAESILNSHTPSLRRLNLVEVTLPWTAPLFRGLTHLDVQLEAQHPKLGHFLDVLDACPDLELLRLHDAHPVSTDEAIPRRVALPRLQTIDLSGRHAAYILAFLVPPATAHIRIPVFRYVPAWHSHLPNLPEIDTFALSLHNPPGSSLSEPVLRGTAAPARTDASTAAPRVLLESPFGDHPLVIVFWIDIARLVGLCRASTFLLGPGEIADPKFACTEWAQGLANMACVRTLALHTRKAFCALVGMTSDTDTDANADMDAAARAREDAAPVLCPALEHLELGDFQLSRADVTRVERWVARRRARGASALQMLRLCDMRPLLLAVVERLRKIVPSVVVLDEGVPVGLTYGPAGV